MPAFPTPWNYGWSPGAIFEIEPPGIYANATLKFIKILPCYPAGDWVLQYGFVPFAGQISGPITFQSAPFNSTDIHLIDVVPAITKLWAPQRYKWQVFAQVTSQGAANLGIDSSTRNYLSTGMIDVFADLTITSSLDTRGFWQKIVDKIDQMILDTAEDAYEEIAIGRGTVAGQNIKGWQRKDLLEYRDYAMHMAQNESRIQNRRGGAPNPRIKYAVMGETGSGIATNGFPDILPFS